MKDYNQMDLGELQRFLNDCYREHLGLEAQARHPDTPKKLKIEFLSRDRNLNDIYVEAGNIYCRRNNLHNHLLKGSWDKLFESKSRF